MRSTGRLYAFDVSATRLAKAKPRFARSGLSNIVPVAIEHENDTRVRRLAGKAHRVLVDAPCSGVGTLRRNPDLKWRQSVQSLQELTALQARILASASRCVAPGGRLVYATCSILKEENQDQAALFLVNHPEFELVDAAPILSARTDLQIEGPYLSLRPDVHGTDGFFAAIFERKKILVAERLESEIEQVSDAESDILSASDALLAPDNQELLEPHVDTEVEAEAEPIVKPKAKPRAKPKAKVKAAEKPKSEDTSDKP
jgi:16S rRNA (cytosine967-C5)-methyltransferase